MHRRWRGSPPPSLLRVSVASEDSSPSSLASSVCLSPMAVLMASRTGLQVSTSSSVSTSLVFATWEALRRIVSTPKCIHTGRALPWRHEPPIAVYEGHGEALHRQPSSPDGFWCRPLAMRWNASPRPCLHCLLPCVRRSLSHRWQRPRPPPRTADSDHSNRRYGNTPIPPAFREP